ncbi:hypothetical protein B0H63DRAFT_472614 [Podospora didyma]|uniref:Uncharacterized protein n=1 Tax=Podospora didyma TaxID=330526 RepID=A0AAE0TZD2_9PEZI|nr:hypothetical protein B0H63DRAFT_472614 [Podospora didyma]
MMPCRTTFSVCLLCQATHCNRNGTPWWPTPLGSPCNIVHWWSTRSPKRCSPSNPPSAHCHGIGGMFLTRHCSWRS